LDASPHLEFYDIETDSEVYKRGIYTEAAITAGNPEEMISRVYNTVANHIDQDRFVVTLGGEHSVAIGAADAYARKYDQLTVLQLDAHSDLRDSYLGSKYNHACVMARIKELCPITQVGIRSMDREEIPLLEKNQVFFAHDIHDSSDWVERVVSSLGDTVYVTIDLDVFDSGIMPSTGTPEPGGLNWHQVTKLLKAVAFKKKVVGFDVVELCPSFNKAPDFLAAKLIYTFLSYIWR
jgi:agmatinase